VPGIEPGPPDLQPRTLTTRPQRRSISQYIFWKIYFHLNRKLFGGGICCKSTWACLSSRSAKNRDLPLFRYSKKMTSCSFAKTLNQSETLHVHKSGCRLQNRMGKAQSGLAGRHAYVTQRGPWIRAVSFFFFWGVEWNRVQYYWGHYRSIVPALDADGWW
jgi:hypothetical protein